MNEFQTLSLKDILLDSLPKNFSFNGNLDLTDSNICSLPEGLRVRGDLILGENIKSLPEDLIVGGNLYGSEDLQLSDGSIIYGCVCLKFKPPFEKDSTNPQFIELDNGKKFFYHKIVHHEHKARNPQYNRPPYDIYQDPWADKLAVEWTSFDNKKFKKSCLSTKHARFLINYQTAIENGIEQYRDLDIDTPMSGHKIKEIYIICTDACGDGIDKYLKHFELDLDKEYTIREIGNKVKEYKKGVSAPASEIFLSFFNISTIKEEIE